MFELGSKVKDRITGFEGVVTARHEYVNGCIRYSVQPLVLDKDGKPQDSIGFDEEQLDAVPGPLLYEVPPRPPIPGEDPARTGGPDRAVPPSTPR